MLAKKKAERRAAVAASATGSKRVRSGEEETGEGSAHTGRRKKSLSLRKTPAMTRDDVISGATDNREQLIQSLGENIDTRLKEITFEDDIDRELDPDAYNERRLELMEEARLAAGTAHRAVAAVASQFLSQSSPDGIRQVRLHHNSNAVTAVASLGCEVVVFGDKTGKVYWVDVSPDTLVRGMTPGECTERIRRKKVLLEPSLGGSVLSIAISDTRLNRPNARDLFEKSSVDNSCPSYTAVGAADGSIGVWETFSRQSKGLLFMHRKPVTGLSFRMHSSTLHSVSEDSVLRVWSVPQMMMVDSLFGHTGKVFGIHGLRKDTCASVGEDGSMRFWKVEAATQQGYSYLIQHRNEAKGIPTNHTATGEEKKNNMTPISLECVSMLNETTVVVGAVDGTLLVFDVNKRKPVVVVPAAHGYGFVGDGTGLEKEACEFNKEAEEKGASRTSRQNPNPITAVATVPYSDLAATGSLDGVVRLWQLSPNSEGGMALKRVAELPVNALVSTLAFSPDGDQLCIACSKEPRLGRWVVQRRALNSILLVPLSAHGLDSLRCLPDGVEHVPALLYGFQDDEEEEQEEEETTEKENPVVEAEDELQEYSEEPLSSSEADEATTTPSTFFSVGEDGQLLLNAPELTSPHYAKKEKEGETEDVMKKKKKPFKTAKKSIVVKKQSKKIGKTKKKR